MSISLYDDALVNKIQGWVPENSSIRIYRPNETEDLFRTTYEENKDSPIKLPFISLTRSSTISVSNTSKRALSFDGARVKISKDKSITLNALPIELNYQLNIYTKYMEEALEYIREFAFKIVNDPKLTISIPYNNINVEHTSNIRMSNDIQDTSDVPQNLFNIPFSRFTISLYIDDAYLFSAPIKTNKIIDEVEVSDNKENNLVNYISKEKDI